MNGESTESSLPRSVTLIGAGVVGQAILRAHLDRDIPVVLADIDPTSIDGAIAKLSNEATRFEVSALPAIWGVLPATRLTPLGSQPPENARLLVIESIAERLEIKQDFFRRAESWFDDNTIFCSNTSTIRIASIGQSLRRPDRLCGMHFFMPVDRRDAVEVIRTPLARANTIDDVRHHVRRLGKEPLVVADAPGFVVNRMLAPYLNQAMTLLCGGVSDERIEAAAIAYGMPMSPLELIDWIGTRTTFDAGRVYWQAFPARIDPSPLIAALVKRKRTGRGPSGGFYDYANGIRSATIASEVRELAGKYHRELPQISDADLIELLAIPMWIEASKILAENVVAEASDIETAMYGGLGYTRRGQWHAFFESLGGTAIQRSMEKWSPTFRSMTDR